MDVSPSVGQIICSTNYAAPSLTTRSVGNKLILYPSLTASELDYAIGVESSDMFFSVEKNAAGYTFYAGMTVVSTISGNGNIATNGSVAAASAQISDNCTIGGTLNITGAITTTAFYASKPWAGFHCISHALPATVFQDFLKLVFYYRGLVLGRMFLQFQHTQMGSSLWCLCSNKLLPLRRQSLFLAPS